MNPDAPSDRPNTNAQPPEPPAAMQAAYPSDLAALVLTRWHEATAAGQIDLPPPATSTLADVLSICYQATLLREEGRPVTFRLALSEPDAFAPAAGPPSGLHRLVFTRPLRSTSTNSEACSRRRVFPFVDWCYGRGWRTEDLGCHSLGTAVAAVGQRRTRNGADDSARVDRRGDWPRAPVGNCWRCDIGGAEERNTIRPGRRRLRGAMVAREAVRRRPPHVGYTHARP